MVCFYRLVATGRVELPTFGIDGGGENTAINVQKLIVGRGIKQYISKKQVKFSNSMVEVLFRQLKQKFLGQYKAKNFKSLYGKIRRFVLKYNYDIPHNSLHGATPTEMFNKSFDVSSFREIIQARKEKIRKMRKLEFCKCTKCVSRFGQSFCLS